MPKLLACFGWLVCGAAGVAHAQSIQLFGTLDLRLTHVNASPQVPRWSLDGGGDDTSSIGLRVADHLREDVNLNVVLEHGFRADTGSAADPLRTSFNRQAWIGFSSPRGEARFGRQLSALHEVLEKLDAFAQVGFGSVIHNTVGHARRFDNLAAYRSRRYGAFSWHLQFAPGEQAEPDYGRNRYVAGAEYETGAAYAALGLVQQNSADALYKIKTVALGASYALPAGRVYAAAVRGNDNGGDVETSVPGTYYTVWSLSADHRFSPASTVAAGVGAARDTGPAREHAWQASVMARHELSLRSALYAVATRLVNRNGARFTLDRSDAPMHRSGAPGSRINGLQLGLRMRF